MEKTFAKSFCVEHNPFHLKQDSNLVHSAFQCKAGTKNSYRTITKDMWYKIHPIPKSGFINVRRYLSDLPQTTDTTDTTRES